MFPNLNLLPIYIIFKGVTYNLNISFESDYKRSVKVSYKSAQGVELTAVNADNSDYVVYEILSQFVQNKVYNLDDNSYITEETHGEFIRELENRLTVSKQTI